MSARIRAHPTARPATRADVEAIALFEGLEDEVTDWVVAQSQVISPAADEILVEPEDEAEEMIILLAGAMEFEFELNGHDVVFRRTTVGDVTGALPYSRMTHYQGRATAIQDSRMLWFPREKLTDLVRTSAELGQRLVAIMADRVRDATRFGEQRERMASLGKLSAGLAHELNNPASAVRRAAAALRDRLASLPTHVARLAENELSYAQVCRADELREMAIAVAANPPTLSALERSRREDAMADWLEEHGVTDPFMRAETLVDAGITTEQVEKGADGLPAEAVADLLAWVECGLAADRLLGEIEAAATRISDLVSAVKAYSHSDRAQGCQPVNLRPGILTTLKILEHKLRRKSIDVQLDLPEDLPEASGYPAELNQVWTNLIDNAIDAMAEGGTLRIEAGRTGRHIEVRVIDDGAGIPEDIRSRIFDPFFTTKDVGQGTGLGLDIVRRIIEGKHAGSIDVESSAGRTVFTVRLDLA